MSPSPARWHRRRLPALLLLLAAGVSIFLRRVASPTHPLPPRGLAAPPPPLAAAARLPARVAGELAPGADDWARPRAVAVVGVPCRTGSGCVVQIFVMTQGVYAPAMGWELRVGGCVVGRDVYKVVGRYSGTFECRVDREVRVGESVSVVVDRNEKAEGLRVSGARLKSGTDGERVRVHSEGDLVVALGLEPPLVAGAGVAAPEVGWLYVRSAVAWNQQMDSPPPPGVTEGRYELCMATQEKTFPEDLEQWVDYHRRLGVDLIVIYDNHAAVDGGLGGYSWVADATDVEVLYWPHVKSQLTMHAHILVLARRRCEWLLLIDVDEWVLVAGGDDRGDGAPPPLKRTLLSMRKRSADLFYMRDIEFGPSGHHYRPSQPIPEAYTHLMPSQSFSLGKPGVRMDAATPNSKVHFVSLQRVAHERTFAPKPSGSPATGDLSLTPGAVYLAHYKRRSWEDYVRKGQSGRNSMFVRDWNASMGAGSWHVDRPGTGYVQPAASSRPWNAVRDAWRAACSRPLPARSVVRTEDGLRCTSYYPRSDSLHGVPNKTSPFVRCELDNRKANAEPDAIWTATDYDIA